MTHSDAAYRQTLDYLYAQLPMFSRIGAAAIKKDLGNTLALCAALGNPQQKLKCIHIAGSNGKGSTSHMLAAILQQSGYKTGLYTSPHLLDFRERIRIAGGMLSKDFVTHFVEAHRAEIEHIKPSFFEITVAMAFAAFAAADVQVAVVETGLGGRLDSTNVITPELSIITNISLEHTDLLGDTIAAIAAEKAGIIKPGRPVVIGENNAEALPVFERKAQQEHATQYHAFAEWQVWQQGDAFVARRSADGTTQVLECPLKGSYQQANIATVLTAVDVLHTTGWELPEEAVQQGLRDVIGITGLRGRWDVWQHSPMIVADVAHNPAGLAAVMDDWARVAARQKHILLGFVRDKDVRQALSFFSGNEHLHFCAANVPRALPAEELMQIAADLGLQGRVYRSVAAALAAIRASMTTEDALLITGSFFIVGDAMEAYGFRED